MVTHHRIAVCCVCLAALGCESEPEEVVPASRSSAATSAPKPVDRLAPGELAAGKRKVFGLPIPRGMSVDADFGDSAHISGEVSAEAVANYVRDHVHVRHIEIGAGRTIFPRAIVKKGDPDRALRIEIIPDRSRVRVLVEDLTPPPTTQGLSEAERWRRAGMTPTGEVLDPKRVE